VRTPNSVTSYSSLAAIVLQSNQNEQHGGQSIPIFDYAISEGVRKSFVTSVSNNLFKIIQFISDLEVKQKEVKLFLNDFISQNPNNEIRYCSVDQNTLEKLLHSFHYKFNFELTHFQLSKVVAASNKDVYRETFQAMESLIHNLNTMHSRAGAQVPFTSLNFGTIHQQKGD
jgi:ribonucleoside-triphosphate reductase